MRPVLGGAQWFDSTIRDKPYGGSMSESKASRGARAGISFGCALAIAISWSLNKSILWAILHGICSWLYVIYYAIFK